MEVETSSWRSRYLKVPLRIRLTVWYTAVLSFALIGFSIFTYITVSNSLHQNLDYMLSEVTSSIDNGIYRRLAIVRDPVIPPIRPRGDSASKRRNYPKLTMGTMDSTHVELSEESVDEILSGLAQSAFMKTKNFYLQVADTTGRVIWRSANLRPYYLPTYDDVTDGQDTGKIVLDARMKNLALRVQTLQSAQAEISVGYSLQEVDDILVHLSNTLQVGFPVALLIALGIGYFLARYSLRQVDIITNSAKRITAENLSKRLPLPTTNDEIARLTMTLNEMIARLDASFTQVRQFTSDVSHELRTPLAILMGELELALRNETDEEQYQMLAASALEEVVRLSKMVSSLLEISRAETGQVKLKKSLFDISMMTSDICDDMEILAEDRRITLEKNIQPFVTIVADESRIHQMLLNVIDNAIKYTHMNGKVRVTLTTKAAQTKIEISDTGVGISEEDVPYVFNRFFRVDKARSSDVVGSGLGLSIVKWIVDAHRGTIRVKSELGEGSTFTIILPYES